MQISRIQQTILVSIPELQVRSNQYVGDQHIAESLNLEIQDVRDHLELMEQLDLVSLAKTFRGCAAMLTARGRLLLKDPSLLVQTVSEGNTFSTVFRTETVASSAPKHDLARIRQLLLAAFTPEELRRFCYDRPTFRPIVDLFGPGLGAADMVDRMVEYCDRKVLLDELLNEVERENPNQYARFFEPDLPPIQVRKPQEDEPAPPTAALAPGVSDSDTITSPAIREDKKPPDDTPPQLTLEIPTILGPIPLHLVCIPAGEFVMGGVLAKDRHVQDNELPAHRLDLPEFHIGKYPVTNLQYHAFVQATRHDMPGHWEGRGVIPAGSEDHPVVIVSWFDAVAFCEWLSTETGQPVRLPTEAEWEKSARGVLARIYPWGDDPPDDKHCNFNGEIGRTTIVGRYSPAGDSPYGCADMAGNVWEWCQSLYKAYPYRPDDGREDLGDDAKRVLRGGALHSSELGVRCAFRDGTDPFFWSDSVGFRVVVAPG